MKVLKMTRQFKKDLKKYKYQQSKINSLEIILGHLSRGEKIPDIYKPHSLTGDFRGYMECHVENDLLLIWYDADKDEIVLVRFGSHSELLGKGKKR